MKEFTITFKKGLDRGLRNSAKNPRHMEALVMSQGAVPEDGVLHALEDIQSSWLDTSALGALSFPYPQIFVGPVLTLVFTQMDVYELRGGVLVPGYLSAPIGTLWSVGDFGTYIIAANGKCLLERTATTGSWSIHIACDIPECICLCNLNGQLIIGGPGVNVAAGWRG